MRAIYAPENYVIKLLDTSELSGSRYENFKSNYMLMRNSISVLLAASTGFEDSEMCKLF